MTFGLANSVTLGVIDAHFSQFLFRDSQFLNGPLKPSLWTTSLIEFTIGHIYRTQDVFTPTSFNWSTGKDFKYEIGNEKPTAKISSENKTT